MLIHLSLLLSSRALLEGKPIGNLIRDAWASIYEVYVVVVTATTLLLKLGTRVHDRASKGTSLGGQTLLSSQLFWLLGYKLSLILPKCLYGVVMPQTNFLQKVTFDKLYNNKFLIGVCSRTLSISSERNTI